MHLDGNTSRLDEASTDILQSLLRDGFDDCSLSLSERHGRSLDETRSDLEEFERDLGRERVLVSTPRRSGATQAIARSVCRFGVRITYGLAKATRSITDAQVTCFLLGARLLLALFGWARTLEAWQASCPQPTQQQNRKRRVPVLLDATDTTVRNRSARSFLNYDCKERALVALALVRTAGICADLVIGLTFVPLRGHVWVESGERVIGDDLDSVSGFEPVARYCGASGPVLL